MNKIEILVELHALIASRLLGDGPWLMDRHTAAISAARALELGLEEQVTKDSWQLTPLGKEIDFHLLSVFIGRWDPGDIPIILRLRRLITEVEADAIYEKKMGRLPRSRALS